MLLGIEQPKRRQGISFDLMYLSYKSMFAAKIEDFKNWSSSAKQQIN